MTGRERLVKLLDDFHWRNGETDEESNCSMYFMPFEAEIIADYLIKNGVIVPPCQVGDTVYIILDGEITEDVVLFIHYDDNFFFTTSRADGLLFGKSMFLTREEAEKALKERENNG